MTVKPKILLLSLIFFLPAAYTIVVTYCPSPSSIPCLAESEKPRPDDKNELEIAVFYEGSMEDTSTNGILRGYVCQLISECGNLIKIRLVPGASASKPYNNQIQCFVNTDCKPDRVQVCLGFIDDDYLHKCKVPDASKQEMEACLQHREGDINEQLLKNSGERKDKGIAPCYLPVLTFQGKYDGPLCAKYSTYEELKDYVCKVVYKNSLDCCPK